jgi:2-dehydropantoate 2-reductase
MRITVVGAGALGQLLGGLLAHAGHEVAFVARGEARETISARGITVVTPGETLVTSPLAASADPAALGPSDLVILAVKSWQVEETSSALEPLLRPGSFALTVQNGVEAPDQVAKALGEEAVVGGVCHVLAERTAIASVRYKGPPPELAIGAWTGSAGPLAPLANALSSAGIPTTVSEDVRAALWAKLLFVEPFGSIGAATRSSADVFRALPETRSMLEQAMREVHAVATGLGVRLPADVLPRSLTRLDGLPVGATASMHRDLVEGRPSELNEQTGAIVRMGRQAGVPHPVHEVLLATLLPQERRNRLTLP